MRDQRPTSFRWRCRSFCGN